MKFYVRILPSDDFDWNNIKIEDNKKAIYVRCLSELRNPYSCCTNPNFWYFKTDGIFYNNGQEEIYDIVMKGFLQSIYEGIESVILCCGQTCSGKSFTLCAFRSMYEYRGIVPRFVHDLFLDINLKYQDWKVDISLSFVEFHGNQVTDLLRPTNRAVKIKDVTLIEVKSEEHLMGLLFKGERRRNLEPLAWYSGAHRATAVISLHIGCLSLIKSRAVICRSKVHFVDLAGIETVGKRDLTSFKDSKEQGLANKCKSSLEHLLISYIETKNAAGDKYKLKRYSCPMLEYLGSSVSPSCSLRLIGHIRPSFQDLEISLSTLKLGHRSKHVQQSIPKFNIVPNLALMLENFKEDLKSKKETEDFLNKLLHGPSELESGNVSKERIEHLERLLESYLDGNVSELDLIGNAELPLILRILKNLFLKRVKQLENFVPRESDLSKMRMSRNASGSITSNRLSNTKSDPSKSASLLQKNKRSSSKKKRENEKLRTANLSTVSEVENSSTHLEDVESPTAIKLDNFTDIFIPSADNGKLWADFLIKNNITAEKLEDLARSAREKRVLFEIASAEYAETMKKLEQQKLILKKSTLKRRKLVACLSESEIDLNSEHDLTELESAAKSSKKLLELNFDEWIDSTKEFMEEKLLFREKYQRYCENILTYNPPDYERESTKISNNNSFVESTEITNDQNARKHFNAFQKQLWKK